MTSAPTDPGADAELPVPDEVLAVRAALGDRAAFVQIFHRHAAGMFRYALRMVDGDQPAAEDAMQEALIQAWIHLPKFRSESSLRTWLFSITANQVRSARRRRRPIAVDDGLLDAAAEPDHRSPAAQVDYLQLREALDVALAELPFRQRASWLLREVEGLSYEEIAAVLGTSPTVVRGQLHRARRTLAVRMGQWQ